MPIFTASPETLMRDHSAIKAKKDGDYQNNQSIWNVFWTRANQNVRLEAGDPTIMNVWGNNPATIGSSQYYFNRARPIGLMLDGYQRRNRKSTIVVPYENGDNYTADQYTKLMLNMAKKEHLYEKISEAFHQGAIISGMSLIQEYLDFTDDPVNGDIKFRHLAYNEFMIDPYFKEPDLSDAQFIMVRSYMNKPSIAAICPPEWYDEIMRLEDNQQGSTIDGRFQYQASAMGFSMGPKIAYDEYYYRDYREQKIVIDSMTGEKMDVTARDDLDVKQMVSQHENLRLDVKRIPTVRLCITIQDKVFYDGPQPMSIDRMPFVAVIGFYSKAMPYMYNRIQSIMTSLLSPQILFNRRIILNADFLESVVNSGWMFRQSAVIDTAHLFQTGQGRIIPLRDSATPLVDIVPIPAPQVQPSAFQQLEVYDKEMFNVVGLSQENLGKVVEDDSSGYQTALRTAAGLTAQQGLFDRLDLAQEMLGDITLEVIQNNYTPGKVRQLLGGVEPAPQFYDRAFGKYRCTTELGFNTETQQQMEFAQLLELKKAGVQISDARLISKATIQGKDEIIQEMQQQQQQQQQIQQTQMQIQMQEIQSRIELQKANAAAHIGTYNERTARVEENRALALQKIHEANRADEAANLDKIRALKELQSIDLSYLEKLVSIVNALKQQEQIGSNEESLGATESTKTISPESQNGSDLDRGTNLAI